MEEQRKAIIIALVIIFGLTALVVFWPKLTKKKLPEPIKKFRDEVKGTKIGKEIFNVLGETSSKENQGSQSASLIENTANGIIKTTNNVTEKIKEEIEKVIIENIGEKIVEKLNQLPSKEKEEVKKEFCK